MMNVNHTRVIAWQGVHYDARVQTHDESIWHEVTTWLALFITLFITVGGGIKLHYAPIAFALTAMSGDSTKQLALKFAGLLVMLLLMTTRSRGMLSVCLNARSFLLLPALAFASVFWSQSPVQTLTQAPVLALTTLFAAYLYVRYPGDRLVSVLDVAAAISLLGCLVVVVFFP